MDLEAFERPHRLLAVGRGDAGYTAIEIRTGNPATGHYWNLHGTLESGDREAEEWCERDSLPDADGDSSQVLGAWESHAR